MSYAAVMAGFEYTDNKIFPIHFLPPKSGDITRCVNVVDNLGFPPVRMDNQQRFVDKTMI